MKPMAESRREGPDLFLIPGWAMTAGVLWHWCDRLAARWRITVMELPGHGGAPDASFSLPVVARQAAETAPPGALWVGWSLGGQVALQAAAEGADIAGLLLVAATPRFVTGPDWPHGRPAVELQDMQRRLRADPRRTIREFLGLLARGEHDRRVVSLARRGAGGKPRGLESALRCLAESDLRPLLPEIGVPAIWLIGGRDPLVPVAACATAAEAMPQGRLRVIEEAGHLPFLSHPGMVDRALANLCQGIQVA